MANGTTTTKGAKGAQLIGGIVVTAGAGVAAYFLYKGMQKAEEGGEVGVLRDAGDWSAQKTQDYMELQGRMYADQLVRQRLAKKAIGTK